MVVPFTGEIKKRAAERLPLVDLVVKSDGKNGFPDLEKIQYSQEKGWHLRSQTF